MTAASLRPVPHAVLYLAALLAACPIRFHAAGAGLDQSWAVGLNIAAQQGLVHGRDIAFTYGPWAWAALPMGSQLSSGIAWQLAMWALFACVTAYLFFFRDLPLVNLAVFAGCVLAGARTFTDFGYAGPDSYLSFIVLLLLVCALQSTYWLLALCAAIALTGALFLIKLTAGIFALSALVMWPAGMFLLGEKQKARVAALTVAVGTPAACAAMYWLHAGSLTTLSAYVRAALDISSGFAVAMSGPGETFVDLRDAALLFAGFLALAGVLYWRKQRAFVAALMLSGPLFLSFKHSFIRPAGHTEILFAVVPLLLGASVLSADLHKRPVAAAVAAVALVWLQRESGMLGLPRFEQARRILDMGALKAALEAESKTALAPDVIPELPKRPTAVFPFESAILAANAAEFRPFPVFQTYQAYTPFLDGWNAATLADPARAPQQLVVHWASVDGRHPFLDAPSLTMAMMRYYDFAADLTGARLLLTRRSTPRFGDARKVGEAVLELGKPLAIDNTKPLLVRVEMKLNLKGQLSKLLWKLPPSQVLLSAKGGRVLSARLVPDVLAGAGAGMSFVPESLANLKEILTENIIRDPYGELLISGEAQPYYEPKAKVEFYEIDGWKVAMQQSETHRLETLINQGEARAAKIDSINETGVSSLAPNEVPTIDCPQGFALVRGWAFDFFESKPASAVYLQIDGKDLIKTDYGQSRMDNVALFRVRSLEHTGFSAAIPANRLGAEAHEMRLVVVSPDGKRYSASSTPVRFRVK